MRKSGKYSAVYINRQLRTATSGQVTSIKRPDVTGVLKGSGKLNMVEVPHPRQTTLEMTDKIDEMEWILGDLAGPGSYTTPPVKR